MRERGSRLRDSAAGRFLLPVDAVFPLSDIAAAHRQAERVGRPGRVIVKIPRAERLAGRQL